MRLNTYRRTTAARVSGLCLVAASACAQSYSPLFQPDSSNQFPLQCTDPNTGAGIPYAYFTASTGVYLYTNYHYHSSPLPPWSSVSPTSGYGDQNGYLTFTINTTKIGQAEGLIATCSAPGYNQDQKTYNYAVGYSDIYWNDHPDLWVLIGGNTTGHGDNSGNHWMQCTGGCTGGPAYGYYYTVQAYVSMYNAGNPVCANDMALPFGGKFDVDQNWTQPHKSHDRGSAVDTANTANQCGAANVVNNSAAFLQLCVSSGALGYPTSYYIAGLDIHCNWLNPLTYPH